MKTNMSAKVSSKTTNGRKAKSVQKAAAKVDRSVATMETRLLTPTGINPKVLVGAMRLRITPEVRDKLEAEVAAEPSGALDLGMPVNVYTSEAITAAVRLEWHLLPRDGIPVSLAPHEARIGGDVGPQIVYLVDQARISDSMVVQGRATDSDKLVERARFILVRLRSAAEVVVDDGVRDGKDTIVEALRQAHASIPSNIPALASALAAYVDVCRMLTSELATLDGFEPAMVDEGAEVADMLSARKATSKNELTRSALLRRNRLLQMIRDRLAKLRKIVRYAFASHPETMREFFSAFNRDTRRAQKRDDSTEPDLDQEPIDGIDGSTDEEAPMPEPNDDPV